jgi:hypothetical protein
MNTAPVRQALEKPPFSNIFSSFFHFFFFTDLLWPLKERQRRCQRDVGESISVAAA